MKFMNVKKKTDSMIEVRVCDICNIVFSLIWTSVFLTLWDMNPLVK